MRAAWPPTTAHQVVGAKGRREGPTPRRLTTREHHLPWASFSFPSAPTTVNHPARALGTPAAAVACSRGVNAGSCPNGPRHGTVARPANSPPDAGGAGMPVNAIGPPFRASNAAANRPDVIAAADHCARPTPSQGLQPARPSPSHPWSRPSCHPPPTQPSRPHPPARASAQTKFANNPRDSPATAQAATSCSSPRPGRRSSISAPAPVARRYDASDSGKHGSGTAAVVVAGRCTAGIATPHSTTPLMSSCIENAPLGGLSFPCPQRPRRERVGRVLRSPVSSLGNRGRGSEAAHG
jgi:hypothetical protein